MCDPFTSIVYVSTSLFCCADFGNGRPGLSIEETEVLDNLIATGSGLEDLELTDELLRDHELTPSLNSEDIHGKHIRMLGAKPIPFAFQVPKTISSGEEGQANMVNLNLTMLRQFGARSVATSSVAQSLSSRDGRSEQPRPRPRPQQTHQHQQ